MQGNTTALSGTVQDPPGRVVPAAGIVVHRLDTGAKQLTITLAEGHYIAAEPEPDTCEGEAE